MKILRIACGYILRTVFSEANSAREKVKIMRREIVEHINDHTRATRLDADNDKHTLTLGQYRHVPIKNLIWSAKYDNDEKALKFCADLLSDELISIMEGVRPLVTYIPSTACLLHERLNDHMQIISTYISPLIQNFADVGSCLKINTTRKYIRQSKTENRDIRFAQARDKFTATGVAGRSVIILDDIVTTGATIVDAERALRAAGAIHIYSMAVAH